MIRTLFSCIFAACLSLNTCCYTQLDTRNIFQTRLVVRFASVLTVTALGMHRSLRMSLPFLPVGTRAFFFSAHITKYTGTHNKDRTKIRGTTHKVAYSRPRCKIRTGTPKIRIPWCVRWVVGSTYCTSVFLLIRKREGHRMNTRGTPSLVPPPATETSDFFFT